MQATGILSWPRAERISDRYGFIHLTPNVPADAIEAMAGRRVSITCVVVETRQSGHIGDLFRGIFPSTPDVGERFDLGSGVLEVDRVDAALCFGLRPDDGRDSDWFDPHVLYRLHDQTVEIQVSPAAREAETAGVSA